MTFAPSNTSTTAQPANQTKRTVDFPQPGLRSGAVIPALASLTLAVATLAVFWPVFQADFVNYDDPEYVTDNHMVQEGLTKEMMRWAATTSHFSYWHPLTWFSHALDCQLFGLHPAGHHATSLLFHLANTILLFLLLRRMTQTLWRSAFVAALFALHPLHVESVAWVCERKDVLSTFFGFLSIWAYVSYAQARGRIQHASRRTPRHVSRFTGHTPSASPSWVFHLPPAFFYTLALFFFAFGLMSKPMLVMLPFILLLLDYWPLGRTHALRLLLEKLPFVALAVVSGVVTFVTQRRSGVLPGTAMLPLQIRLGNSAISYLRYLKKTFWPNDLAVFYPYVSWPAWEALGAGLVLLVVTAVLLRMARRRPYLAVGWLWFLGTLVPAIGLVQSGSQSMADRYSYVPLIGIFIMVVWGISDLTRGRQVLAGIGGLVVLGALSLTAAAQVRHWRNSITLFQHTLAVTADNALAHNNLGEALFEQGHLAEAAEHYREALAIAPQSAMTLCNLGIILAKDGNSAEARRLQEAALQLKPALPQAHYHLALLDMADRRSAEAIAHWRSVLQAKPHWADALNNLAWLLATSPDPKLRDGAEAVRLAQRSCALAGSGAPFLDTLAAAYAETGRFPEAVATIQHAITLAETASPTNSLAKFRSRLELYRQQRPFHESP
jgi:tetratricopeptide (TPR) repeat protein